jgi:tetratricopeptide (TPR) repeat protein
VLLWAGRLKLAGEVAQQLDEIASDLSNVGPDVAARVHEHRALSAYYRGDAWRQLTELEEAFQAYQVAGDARRACQTLGHIGFAWTELGELDSAIDVLRGVETWAARLGLAHVTAEAHLNLGVAFAARGELEKARPLAAQAIGELHALGIPRMEGAARRALSLIACAQGDLDVAEREAAQATTVLAAAPPKRAGAIAAQARVLLRRGQTSEALRHAAEASAIAENLGCVDEGEAAVHLVFADALAAAGRDDEARAAFARARARLEARAAMIPDEKIRSRFLSLPDHVATMK